MGLAVDLSPGTMLGKYELLAPIGKGGAAQIILARQRGPAGFAKLVVIKCVHSHRANNPRAINMLLDEARLAAQIEHPNVVHVHELAETDGMFYIVMEYLAGESLAQIIERAALGQHPTLAPQLAAWIVAQAAAGLHAAHELADLDGRPLDLIHRDVSPQNIVVLYNGGVKVVDFGIAKAHGRVTETQDGVKKGKYGFMSPEQITGAPLDRRTDVFSLGVVLWEALTLRKLFRSDSVALTLENTLAGKVVAPSKLRPDVSPSLDHIVLKALALDPRDRFQTAAEMKGALDDTIWAWRCGPSEAEAHLGAVFADRARERRELLARSSAAVLTDADCTAIVDAAWFRPSWPPDDAMADATDATADLTVAQDDSGAREAREDSVRRRIGLGVLGGAAIALLALVVLSAGSRSLPQGAAAVGRNLVAANSRQARPPPPRPLGLRQIADAPVQRVMVAPLSTIAPKVDAPVASAAAIAARTGHPSAPAKAKPATAVPAVPARARKSAEANSSVEALYQQATELHFTGSFGQARSAYQRVLAANPNHARAYRGLGLLYQQAEDAPRSIVALETYLRLRPSAPDAGTIRRRIALLSKPEI